MNFKDKVAIVTGASSGIGLETAKLLAERESKVVLVARSKDALEQLSKQLPNSLVIVADLSKESEVRSMVKQTLEHFGRVDILINNAGRGYDALTEHIDISKLRELIELNYIGPLAAMQEVIPIMRTLGGGNIVNISSGTSFMNIPNVGAYSSLKRGLNGLSLTAREELYKDNIIVSLVYPYLTETNFGKNMLGKPRLEAPQPKDSTLPPGDPPKYIAEKIIEALQSGEAEILAHDWMRNIK